MDNLYYFVDSNGDQVEVEENLTYLHDEFHVLKLLYGVGMAKGFTNEIYSHLFTMIESLQDVVDELYLSFHFTENFFKLGVKEQSEAVRKA